MAATTSPADPRAAGRRRAEMRRHTRQVRLWVACAAVTLFIAVFTVIYAQTSAPARSAASAASSPAGAPASPVASTPSTSAPSQLTTQQS